MSEDKREVLVVVLCALLAIGFFAAIIAEQQVALGWLLIALAPVTLIWRTQRLLAGFGQRSWLAVEGVVTKSEVWEYRFIKHGASLFAPCLDYRYNVNGKVYEIKTEVFGRTGARAEVLKPYPPGRAITVHYDPQHPERATLSPGNRSWDYLMLLLPLGLAVFGVGLVSGRIFPPG